MSDVVVREARSHAELHACVDLQIKVWGFAARDAVPFNQLLVAHEWGGRVFVALDGDRVVGFCYGLAGRQYGRPALLSHMLAVLPEYRGKGIGVRLKIAQGRWAREQGYDLVTWTYDPLEATNAYLNIARLGGVVRRYLVNHYGNMTDDLNRGLPSDRLLVEWRLERPAVMDVLAGKRPPACNANPVSTIVVPRNFQAIKSSDPDGAMRWRMTVRSKFQEAFGNGLIVTGLQLDRDRATYLLSQEE